MTKTFERFLRSFDDEELMQFARERGALRPPYWRVLRLALQIEIDRRGLHPDPEMVGPVVSSDPETPARSATA